MPHYIDIAHWQFGFYPFTNLPECNLASSCPDVPHLQRPVIGPTDYLLIVHLKTSHCVLVSCHGHFTGYTWPTVLHGQVPHLNEQKEWQNMRDITKIRKESLKHNLGKFWYVFCTSWLTSSIISHASPVIVGYLFLHIYLCNDFRSTHFWMIHISIKRKMLNRLFFAEVAYLYKKKIYCEVWPKL